MEELLAKDEEELPMSDTKGQRRRELMAKSREQASSEEDENPAAPPPGGSVFTKALKVSEGLYQFSEDQLRSSTNSKEEPLTAEATGANSSRICTWTSSAKNCWISWVRTGGGPRQNSCRPRPPRRRLRQSTRPDKRRAPSRPECSSPLSLPSVRGRTRSALPLRRGSLSRPRRGGTSAWMTSRPSRTLTSKRSSRWEGTPFRRLS